VLVRREPRHGVLVDLGDDRIAVDERQQVVVERATLAAERLVLVAPAPGLRDRRVVPRPHRRHAVLGRLEVNGREHDLLDLVLVVRPGGGLAHVLDGGQKHPDEDANDRDDDQQLDQRETAAPPASERFALHHMTLPGTRHGLTLAGTERPYTAIEIICPAYCSTTNRLRY